MSATPDEVAAALERSGQRMRTYRGEDRARLTCPAPPLDGTQRAAQAYVDRVTRSAWWAQHCPPSWMGDDKRDRKCLDTSKPPRRIVVHATHGVGALAGYSVKPHRGRWLPWIRLGAQPASPDSTSRTGWSASISDPYVILHEVAHIMSCCNGGEDGHGAVFRYYHVILVDRWVGPEQGQALRDGYAAEGRSWGWTRAVKGAAP